MPTAESPNPDTIIQKYSDMVYRLAYAKMGTRHDADEVYQNVFFRYIKRNPSFHSDEHQKAWFLRVTINCCNSILASAWRKKVVFSAAEHPEHMEKEEYIDLQREIFKLPEKYRAVIHLFYFEDMSTEAVAGVLRLRPSTVRTQLTRARAMLKERIAFEL